MKMVCIVCPRGCHLEVEGDVVRGATCKRGEAFAREEQVAPKRSVTTTVATSFKQMPVLPVRTDGEIPKEKIFELMRFVATLKVTEKLKVGDVVAQNVLDSGVNLISTAAIL